MSYHLGDERVKMEMDLQARCGDGQVQKEQPQIKSNITSSLLCEYIEKAVYSLAQMPRNPSGSLQS